MIGTMILTMACSEDNENVYKTPTPVPQQSMSDWKDCMVRGISGIEYVTNWYEKKDFVWLRCMNHLPDDKVEEASKIMNAMSIPGEKGQEEQ